LKAGNRCFNCTEIGHQSSNCPERENGDSRISVSAARYYEYSDPESGTDEEDTDEEGSEEEQSEEESTESEDSASFV